MEIKLGLVYHKEEEAILTNFKKELEHLASADRNTFKLIVAEINDFTATRLVKKLEEVDVLVNCLSFNFLVAENLFASEWMSFLKGSNKRFSVLFRACIWELSYFSKFKTLPESHSPLLEVDYETSGFKRKMEEIYDYILRLKAMDTVALNGISETKVEKLKALIIKDDLNGALALLKGIDDTLLFKDQSTVDALLGRLSSLEKEVNDGIISYEDRELSRNKIRTSLLNLITKLSN